MTTHTLTRRRGFAQRNRIPLILMGLGGLMLVIAGIVALARDLGTASTYDFTLPALDGAQVSLSDYEGQVVLVNFWATWCPPCQAEMPLLEAYYQTYRDQGFALLAINVNESPHLAGAFIASSGYTFPVLLDEFGEVSDRYGVSGMPTSVVLGPDGELLYRHSGMISAEVLDSVVTPLLNP